MAESISGASIDFFSSHSFVSFMYGKKVLVHNVSEWLAGVENFWDFLIDARLFLNVIGVMKVSERRKKFFGKIQVAMKQKRIKKFNN